jgi:hypothetical protein
MGLVEYDDAVLDDLRVGPKEELVEDVVVGHDEESSEALRVVGVEIWAKYFLPSQLLHYLDVQQLVRQFLPGNRDHLFLLLVKFASCLLSLLVHLLVSLARLQCPPCQFHSPPTSLHFLLPAETIQTFFETKLLPGGKNGHIGSVASLGQFFLDLAKLGVRAGQVDDIMTHILLAVFLLHKGKHRCQQAKSLARASR